MTNNKILPSNTEKQSRFYYGYIIVLASFIILVIAGGALYSFGVFLKPVLSEFGWTRAATSGAYSLNMVLMGIFGILAGRLSDRFGNRVVLTICGLCLGLGYLLMSQVSSIWLIYLSYGVFISIGMSGMTVPLMSAAARWFVRKRGLVSGIVVSGIGVGIVVIPPMANFLISTYSWRTSYTILGAMSITLIVILAQFLKRAPSQVSILTSATDTRKTADTNLQVQGLSLREAARTRQFWTIAMMYLFFGFGLQTVFVHIVAHATDINISAAAAATIMSVIGFISIGGKIGLGSLGDRIGTRNVMVMVFSLTTLSFIWLIFSGELWMLYLFAVVFGLGYGGFGTLQSTLIADYFGLKAHGVIFGLLSAFGISIGGALGPLTAGRIFDVSGSYHWSFIICVVLALASLVLSISLKKARK